MSDKSNLTFCFPPSLPPCMAEFANCLLYTCPNRILSSRDERNRANRPAKIVESPSIFCKDTIKPSAKANLFAFCRGGVFKVQPNIRIGPGARANLAEVWAIGDNALYRTDNRLSTPFLLLCPVVGSACYESCETEFPGLCSGCPIPISVRSGNIRCRKFK